MHFHDYSKKIKEDEHALLSASKYHWLNYTDDKLADFWYKNEAAKRGTELHEHAKRCIELRIKLEDKPLTLNMYVNDAIGFNMTPEQVLYYSDNCFGRADAISFSRDKLRIHDLKTGTVTTPDMRQLYIYDGLFCLEYDVNPRDIMIENRIYWMDNVLVATPTPDDIYHIMDRITYADKFIENLVAEAEGE